MNIGGKWRAVLLQRCCAVLGIAAFAAITPVRPAAADPVWGEVLPLRQPDGTRVQVRIWGDEYYQVVESLDGHTLVRDPQTGIICYARLAQDGAELVSTGVPLGGSLRPEHGVAGKHLRVKPTAARAKAMSVRSAMAAPAPGGSGAQSQALTIAALTTTGSVQGLCLIVDFSDDPGTILPSAVSDYCNKPGYNGYGNNGSVRDYFYSVSDGQLTYTNYVPAAYYRAAHPKSYYTDSNISYGTRARELILEALAALNTAGLDFRQFDSNNDGIVDALNCLYAGYSESAWSVGLWPHASSVTFHADGVRTNRYQITDMQNSLRLSTFCHENGHMLCGWPDLYDYGHDSNGVGRFCIMCAYTSSTNPQEPCAYLKHIAGWSTTHLLTTPQTGLQVPASSTNVCYKYDHPTKSTEYYLIENRQKTGRDSGLPGAGLAIWHIDTTGSNNNQERTPESHYRVTLVQADGLWELEREIDNGDANDLWAAPSHTRCDPYTVPNTNWWNGANSFLAIGDISTSGPTMTFTFVRVNDCNQNEVADDVDIASGASDDCNHSGIPDECELDSDDDGTIDDCDADMDDDGVPNTGDNCPLASNPGQEDSDLDGVGDPCDACRTIPGIPVDATGCPVTYVQPDLDRDGDVDQEDFGLFQLCLTTLGVPQTPAHCQRADFSGDETVNASDMVQFQACYSGPNNPAPVCGQ